MNFRHLLYSFFEFFVLFVVLSFLFTQSNAAESNHLEEAMLDLFKAKENISKISIDEIRYTINNLTSFPNNETPSRDFGTLGGLMAAVYLKNRLENLGIPTTIENFTMDGTERYSADRLIGIDGHNVVGELKGSSPNVQDEILLLTAHYDSRNYNGEIAPGADDNASGVAVIIEIARIFTQLENHRTIRFILFDGGEYGLYGSQHYIRQHKAELDNVKAVINIDRIGGSSFFIWYGKYSYKFLYNDINTIAKEYNAGFHYSVPEWAGLEVTSDHVSFWLQDIPACTVMRYSYNDRVHTENDVLSYLNLEKIKSIAQIFSEVTYYYSQSGKFSNPDPIEPNLILFGLIIGVLLISRLIMLLKDQRKSITS